MQVLLEYGADVEVQSTHKKTAVCSAAECGHLNILKLLISLGSAQLNNKDVEGDSILHYAAASSSPGNVSCFKYLIDQGVLNVNAINNIGESVLMRCCRNANHNCAQILINSGADVNCRMNNNNIESCCLDTTIMHQDQHTTLALIKAGADIHFTDSTGYTVLMQAVINKNEQAVMILLKHSGKSGKSGKTLDLNIIHQKTGMTCLHYACLFGNATVVRALLISGADATIQDNKGRTPLMNAVACCNVEIAAIFIEQEIVGEGVNLMTAVMVRHCELVSEKATTILSVTAEDVANSKDMFVRSFVVASSLGYFDVIHSLTTAWKLQQLDSKKLTVRINEGVFFNKENWAIKESTKKKKKSFENVCSGERTKDKIKPLVAAICSPFEHDTVSSITRGHTLLEDMKDKERDKTVELLLTLGADPNQQGQNETGSEFLSDGSCSTENYCVIEMAALRGQLNVVRLLIASGADVNNNLSLIHSCESNYTDIVKLLLENGADIQFKNKIGWNALMVASVAQEMAVCTILLNQVGAVDTLPAACAAGRIKSVQHLLMTNVDVNQPESSAPLLPHGHTMSETVIDEILEYTSTPIHLARRKKHRCVCNLLLEAGAKETILTATIGNVYHVLCKVLDRDKEELNDEESEIAINWQEAYKVASLERIELKELLEEHSESNAYGKKWAEEFIEDNAVFDQMTSFWNDEKGDSDNVVTESESDSGADDQF